MCRQVTFYEMVQSMLRIVNVSFTMVGLSMLYMSTQALRRTVAIRHRVETLDTGVFVSFIVASALFMFLSFVGIVATWFSMRPLALVHAACALVALVVVVVVSVRAGTMGGVIDEYCVPMVNTVNFTWWARTVGCRKYVRDIQDTAAV